MPGHSFYKSIIGRSGITLVETMIAVGMMALVLGCIASLCRAGIVSFSYAMRETAALANSRRALDAGDPFPGMAWQARQAASSGGLSSTQLILNTAAGLVPQYSLSGQDLQITQSGQTVKLATNITGVQISYYNMDGAGRIMVSTSPAAAALVTTWMQSRQNGQKTYTFFSGGRLRNHS